ncbi:MAG: protein translocase subunit SecF [Chloroflexota bacterium]|nr:protein translocase subunit SecF [Chloroflexota bacterium]
MIDIVKYRYWFFLASLVLILPGTYYLVTEGLRLGIDFQGGTSWQIQFQRPVTVERVRDVVRSAAPRYRDAAVQSFGREQAGGVSTGVSMRLPEIRQDSAEKRQLETTLRNSFGPFTEAQFITVGPAVGTEIARRSILAVGLACIGILGYIAFAFRKVRHPVRYGLCAIFAMLHDVLVVVGIFAILGHFFHVEVDALFVTAVLTIIGFSVHDTIVVFDRIRENQLRRYSESFENIVNYSVVQTLVRSINTSLTVLITLAALYFFGGVTVRNFVLALLIGIASGTFSSIFNASLLLVVWENREWNRWFGRRQAASSSAA